MYPHMLAVAGPSPCGEGRPKASRYYVVTYGLFSGDPAMFLFSVFANRHVFVFGVVFFGFDPAMFLVSSWSTLYCISKLPEATHPCLSASQIRTFEKIVYTFEKSLPGTMRLCCELLECLPDFSATRKQPRTLQGD
jgi:hypothetical protein